MAARFALIEVTRGRTSWADDAVSDWTRRMGAWGGLEHITVKPERFTGDVEAVRREEGRRILARVRPRDRLLVLDERGVRADSHAFAKIVDEARMDGRVILALGGPYGHAPEVREAAWKDIRLSDMVLNHQVARVMAVEQLYRAMTIVQGIPYHH